MQDIGKHIINAVINIKNMFWLVEYDAIMQVMRAKGVSEKFIN